MVNTPPSRLSPQRLSPAGNSRTQPLSEGGVGKAGQRKGELLDNEGSSGRGDQPKWR
jgi:hypothetical protein